MKLRRQLGIWPPGLNLATGKAELMLEGTDKESVFQRLSELLLRRPPWQLLMVGNTKEPLHFTAKTNNALTRMFDLLPALGGVTIRTTNGDLSVSRDFPRGYTEAVDALIVAVFRNNPEITGIVFPATSTRPEHIATADDPHFLPQGKALAAIDAAFKADEISTDEALNRIKALNARD